MFKEEIFFPVKKRKIVARITHSSYTHASDTYMLGNKDHTDLVKNYTIKTKITPLKRKIKDIFNLYILRFLQSRLVTASISPE